MPEYFFLSFDRKKNPFCPEEEDEDILGLEAPYMNASGVLLCLAQCTRPSIAFSINLLVRFNFTPTQRH